MRITIHIGNFTVTITVKRNNRHSAKQCHLVKRFQIPKVLSERHWNDGAFS